MVCKFMIGATVLCVLYVILPLSIPTTARLVYTSIGMVLKTIY